jgi:hypothetical protein
MGNAVIQSAGWRHGDTATWLAGWPTTTDDCKLVLVEGILLNPLYSFQSGRR